MTGQSDTASNHELDSPPWRRVESTLMSTAESIRTWYDERLSPLGLTLSLASLLAYVAEFGPVNQTRAAEHLGQGRASTGSQVDRLESLGLLERIPDSTDRRVWRLSATDAGAEMVVRIAKCDAAIRGELRRGISRDERQMLASLLVRVQRNITARNSDFRNNTEEVPT